MRPSKVAVQNFGRQLVTAAWFNEPRLVREIAIDLTEEEKVEVIGWLTYNVAGILRENLAVQGVEEEDWDIRFQELSLRFDTWN